MVFIDVALSLAYTHYQRTHTHTRKQIVHKKEIHSRNSNFFSWFLCNVHANTSYRDLSHYCGNDLHSFNDSVSQSVKSIRCIEARVLFFISYLIYFASNCDCVCVCAMCECLV